MRCDKEVERRRRKCVRPAVWLVTTPEGENIGCCQHHAWYYRELYGAPRMRKHIPYGGFVTMVQAGDDSTPSLPAKVTTITINGAEVRIEQQPTTGGFRLSINGKVKRGLSASETEATVRAIRLLKRTQRS
jgi:hypothetical protein